MGVDSINAEQTKARIHILPPELLAYIFELGAERGEDEWEDVDDEDEDEDDDDEDEDEDEDKGDSGSSKNVSVKQDIKKDPESDEVYAAVEFQVLVSHVCRHWRQVATDNASLWTYLTFREKPPFEKSKLWIERSKSSPLTIVVDIERRHTTISDGPPTCNDHTQLFLDISEKLWSYADLRRNFVSGAGVVDQILDIVLPHVDHWKDFDVSVRDYPLIHFILGCLAGCGDAPILESLRLYHNEAESEEDEEHFYPIPFARHTFLPFKGNAPKLQFVELWGVHVPWAGHSLFSDLTELQLAFHAMDIRPKYHELKAMLECCPRLETLSFHASGPQPYNYDASLPFGPPDKEWPKEVISLPRVTSFDFAYHSADYATALWVRLHFPALEKLALDFDAHDSMEAWDHFTRILCTPGVEEPHIRFAEMRSDWDYSTSPPIPPSRLAQLVELKLTGLPCSMQAFTTFFSCLTNLRKLYINFNFIERILASQLCVTYHDTSPTTSITDRIGISENPPAIVFKHPYRPDPGPQQIFCPKLEELRVSGLSYSELLQIIEWRKTHGHPIRDLYVDINDEYEEDEVQWLRNNVTNMDYFEPSDAESDDEDDDDDDDFTDDLADDVDAMLDLDDLDVFIDDYDEDDDFDEDEEDMPALEPF